MFNHLVSEERFEVLEVCLYCIRGFQILNQDPEMPQCLHTPLMPLFGPEGELGSAKETVFSVFFFPFLLFLQGSGLEDELVEATSSSSMDSNKVSPVSSAYVG